MPNSLHASYVHELAHVCLLGGQGLRVEEQVSPPLAQVSRSSAACHELLKSTPLPSTSWSCRKDGFRSGSQSDCVIYRRIICLDVNHLGVRWRRIGDQLPRLPGLLHLCCLGETLLDPGVFSWAVSLPPRIPAHPGVSPPSRLSRTIPDDPWWWRVGRRTAQKSSLKASPHT